MSKKKRKERNKSQKSRFNDCSSEPILQNEPIQKNDEFILNSSNKLTVDQRLSIINTCLYYAIYESNVYWQRNAIYLTINSIMLGAIVAFSNNLNSFLFLTVGGFGVFLNWYWLHVNKYSKYFAERWREDARTSAKGNIELAKSYKALLGKSRIECPTGKRPSQVMNQMCASFRILWIIITLIGLYLVTIEILKYVKNYTDINNCV